MFTTRPTLQGTFGMAASTHWLASAAAMAVLEEDGNAYDAAVAAAFVLHVAEPHLNGPGGEVPIIVAPRGEAPQVICGQGPAPAGASVESYRSLGLTSVPGTGLLAAAVPGAFDAWMLLLRDYGTKRLPEVLRFAIHYAERGVPIVENISATIEKVRSLFEREWHSSAETYLPGGAVPQPGELLRNPALAATWRRLLEESESPDREGQIDRAREIWRRGFIGRAIVDSMRTPATDSTGAQRAGVIELADLEAYGASVEEPVSYRWRDWTVCKPGAWSQGPVFLQQLALLPEDLEHGTADYYHRLIEGTKLAMADREAWYGDAASVPVAALLSDDYNAGRRGLIDPTRVSRELRPGAPEGRAPKLPHHEAPGADAAGIGEPTVAGDEGTRGDTCHVDVVDRWGNMVSATPSGGWLQSNPVIAGLGFPLGTRLQMTWLEEGLPNTLTPGKRPRTTLTPSLAMQGDEAVLAFGSPGGDSQDQWTFHTFLGIALRERVRGSFDLQGAIDLPGWHGEGFPDSFYPHAMHPAAVIFENRLDDDIADELRARGHELTLGGPWSEGRVCAVSRDPGTGLLAAAANPRGMQGYAAGR